MIELQTEACLPLTSRQASRVVCHAGVLWVTREGDPRDLFLAAGEWTQVGPGLTLVSALEPSALALVPPHHWWTALTRTSQSAAALPLRLLRVRHP
jgi:hypothetical protein